MRFGFFIGLLFLFGRVNAMDIDTSRYHIKSAFTQEVITIDGLDREAAWANNASVADSFFQNFPYDTAFSETKTQVRLLHDDENLYVFAICYDTSIQKDYVVQSLKRDWSYPRSDAFVVSIEPFLDYSNGFSFGVNPFGAQREGLIENGGSFGVTTAWDNKWYAETRRENGYWTAEFQIPFKSIRYNEHLSQWRINFARNNLKTNENSTWYPVPRILNIAVLSHMGKLDWQNHPKKSGINAAVIPYVNTSTSIDYSANTPAVNKLNAGFDAKVVLTSSLNLDLTVNPDFSQVDVDVQQLNLTRFSLFFPERRQFFIENSDLFGSFGFRQIRPFFSRRIGLNQGKQIPIIAGARLSGKIGTKWRIGAMNMQTAEQKSEGNASTNYSVVAFQRKVFAASNIAGIAVNKWVKQLDSTSGYSNTVLGLDYNLVSKSNKWRGKLFYHQSLLNGNIKEQSQTHASWLMRQTRDWFVMWNHEYVGKNYNAEVGFTPRIFIRDGANNITYRQSYWRLEPELRRRFYPNSKLINQVDIAWYNSTYTDSSFQINDMTNWIFSNIYFQNSAKLNVAYRFYNTLLYYPVDVTGKSGNLAARRYFYQEQSASFTSNGRKKLSYYVGAGYGSFYSGEKISTSAGLVLRMQPKAVVSLDFRRDQVNLPSPNTNSALTLIGPKIEYSFSRKLFSTLFMQYNTQAENMNINARLQYRFAPMSDLFIVFSENYLPNQAMVFGNPNFPFLSVKNRALTIKLSYWFNS